MKFDKSGRINISTPYEPEDAPLFSPDTDRIPMRKKIKDKKNAKLKDLVQAFSFDPNISSKLIEGGEINKNRNLPLSNVSSKKYFPNHDLGYNWKRWDSWIL